MEDSYDEMDKLLNAWKLPQLCEIFREQEINLETLEALTEHDIIELIPKIGPRALFRKHLSEWLTTKSNPIQEEVVEVQTENSIKEFGIDTVENNIPQTYMPIDVNNDGVEIDDEIWIDNHDQDNTSEDDFKIEVLDINNISDDNEEYEVKSKKLKLENSKCFEDAHKQQTFTNLQKETSSTLDLKVIKSAKLHRKRPVDIELLDLKRNQKEEYQRFLDVNEILFNTEEGSIIMEKYAQNPIIDKQTRLLICDLIISHVFAKNLVMDRPKFQDIAEQIVELFPTEDIKTWFIPQMGSSKNSGGSLFYKYYGVYRAKRKAGFNEHNLDDVTQHSNEDFVETQEPSITDTEDSKDIKDKLAFKRAIPKYERLRHSCDFERIDIKTLLESSYEGRGITAFFEKYQTIDPDTRNRLCKLIIMEAFHRNMKMQPRDFYDISCQIVDLFPSENIEKYFLPRGRTPPKGCLYHKYLYVKRKLRQIKIESDVTQKDDNTELQIK